MCVLGIAGTVVGYKLVAVPAWRLRNKGLRKGHIQPSNACVPQQDSKHMAGALSVILHNTLRLAQGYALGSHRAAKVNAWNG